MQSDIKKIASDNTQRAPLRVRPRTSVKKREEVGMRLHHTQPPQQVALAHAPVFLLAHLMAFQAQSFAGPCSDGDPSPPRAPG
jgi:hypothetical protein